jgi:hypothetical protein
MIFTISSFFAVFQIIVQAVAVYYSYKIFSFNRLNKGWLALTFALILMTFRRVTALLIEFSLIGNLGGWLSYTDRIILPTVISVFLFIGLYFMFKNFENFEVVENKIKNIVKKRK